MTQKDIDECNSIYDAIMSKLIGERVSPINGIKSILAIFTALFTSTYQSEADDFIVRDIKKILKDVRKSSESSGKKGVH